LHSRVFGGLLGSCQLINNVVAPFLVAAEVGFQEIRKEEQPQHREDDEQLDQDDDPQLPAYGHAPETFKIKLVYPAQQHHFSRIFLPPSSFTRQPLLLASRNAKET